MRELNDNNGQQYNSETKQHGFARRHYQIIADVISKSDSVDELIERLVEVFETDNPRFEQLKFRKACI